jgi:hypothetical protein
MMMMGYGSSQKVDGVERECGCGCGRAWFWSHVLCRDIDAGQRRRMA